MSRSSRAICFFVALPPSRDLLLCAKHLFVAAIRQPSRGFKDETHQTYCAPNISEPPPTASVACCAHQVQNFDLKDFGVGACGALASTSKFLAEMNKTQDVGKATQKSSALTRCRAERAELDVSLRSANLPRLSMAGAFFRPWQR